MLKQLQIGRLGLGLVLLAAIAGCSPVFAPVTDIPTELKYVMQNKDLFAQDPDDPLADVVAGENRDDLSGLDGCWGAFDGRPVDLTPPPDEPPLIVDIVMGVVPDSLSVADYRVFVFEHAKQEMHAKALTQDVQQPGGFTALTTHTGAFTVDDNLVTLEVLESTFNDPMTGDMITHRPADFGVDHKLSWFVTLDGDRLRVRATPEDEGEVSDDLVFRRFECPEEGE